MSYSFYKIVANLVPNVSGQLRMEVSDLGGGQTQFRFTNNVGVASSICDVYFDDGVLLSMSSAVGYPADGVLFEQSANPADLPEGNKLTPPFLTGTTPQYTVKGKPKPDPNASADSPDPKDGVNHAGEYLDIVWTLKSGMSTVDVINSLATGALRVGLHVQAIGDADQSAGFVNNPTPVVPVPAAAMLGLVGFAMVGWVKRKVAKVS
jgi:hypothetical protein